jgi:hypothetical protein
MKWRQSSPVAQPIKIRRIGGRRTPLWRSQGWVSWRAEELPMIGCGISLQMQFQTKNLEAVFLDGKHGGNAIESDKPLILEK